MFWGTGVTAPLPEKLRGAGKADLLYTNSTLAINPDTGKMVWYFQHLPRDNWDLDHVFERMIVQTQVCPEPGRSAVDQPGQCGRARPGRSSPAFPGKTGIIWTLDAQDRRVPVGETDHLPEHHDRRRSCRPGVPSSMRTSTPQSVDTPSFACPYLAGRQGPAVGRLQPGHRRDVHADEQHVHETSRWRSRKPDRATDTLSASGFVTFPVSIRRRLPSAGSRPFPPRPARRCGPISSARRSTGRFSPPAATWSSPAIIVRRFRAFNAENGAVLWETILNGPVSGRPMTYSVGGRQYLAVGAGGSRHTDRYPRDHS